MFFLGEEMCIARCTTGEMNCTALVDENFVQICDYILKTYFLLALFSALRFATGQAHFAECRRLKEEEKKKKKRSSITLIVLQFDLLLNRHTRVEWRMPRFLAN